MHHAIGHGSPQVSEVYDCLVERMLDGTLMPGQRLLIDEIAHLCSCSREIVTSVFLLLDRDGLVDNYPYRGTFIKFLDPDASEQLFNFQLLVEGAALSRYRKGDVLSNLVLRELVATVRAAEHARLRADWPRFRREYRAFHYGIFKFSASNQACGVGWNILVQGQLAVMAADMSPTGYHRMFAAARKISRDLRANDVPSALTQLARTLSVTQEFIAAAWEPGSY